MPFYKYQPTSLELHSTLFLFLGQDKYKNEIFIFLHLFLKFVSSEAMQYTEKGKNDNSLISHWFVLQVIEAPVLLLQQFLVTFCIRGDKNRQDTVTVCVLLTVNIWQEKQ